MSRVKKEIYNLWDSLCWFKQKSTKVNNCFITCSGKTSGAGAQIQAVLSTMLFADELGIKYVHTPFKKISYPFYFQKIGHNIENEKSYESRWESFTNLGWNELAIDRLESSELNVVKVFHPRQVKKIKRTLYIIHGCHKFADRNPDLYLELLPKFHQKYAESTEKPDLYFDLSRINVAIHLRRGDVTKDSHPKRYTSNRFVLGIVKEVSDALSDLGQKPIFHIYSQGYKRDFSEIDQNGIDFHLNECVFTTFHHMVSADVLVMAKSSFSYSAALFSKGVILYLPFWHKPIKNWLVVTRNGGFNKKEFKSMLEHIINRKSYDGQ
ncbi:MAG: hypothetical protein JSW00_14875 [Thermoplasmata archaeon]|nr:MAG: hypothetical protein JSW00_14875 [Thermoplasmata archaeon]